MELTRNYFAGVARAARHGVALFAGGCALVAGSAIAQQLTANFDDITTLPGAGWTFVNNSAPVGATGWFQGNSAVFNSQAGAATSYLATNFLAATLVDATTGGNVSLWALSPQMTQLSNGIVVTFWTRTETSAPAPDSLEVRLSLNGASTNVGATDSSIGDFTTLLTTINPTLAAGGYPSSWTLVTATLSGLPPGANSGRIGLRYVYPNNLVNGDYIGIDTLSVSAGLPDLTVTKSHTGNFSQGQTGATYTLTVSNAAGAQPTTGTVTLVDTLPAGMTATAMSGTGWSCIVGTMTCTRNDALAGGSSYQSVTLTVNVAANAAASLTNTAAVSGGGEGDTTNDSASDPTTITAGTADLTISKSHSGNLVAGQVGATYTILVGNAGLVPTSGTVTVVDTLPAGLTATAINGGGWSCDLPSLTCTRGDALAGGDFYGVIDVTVNVAANATGTLTNVASVAGGGDANGTNNSASDPAAVRPAAAPQGAVIPVPVLNDTMLALLALLAALGGMRALRKRRT